MGLRCVSPFFLCGRSIFCVGGKVVFECVKGCFVRIRKGAGRGPAGGRFMGKRFHLEGKDRGSVVVDREERKEKGGEKRKQEGRGDKKNSPENFLRAVCMFPCPFRGTV